MSCGDVLRSRQSWEQYEGHRVPQRKRSSCLGPHRGGGVRSRQWSQVKCLACHSPIWLPAAESQTERTWGEGGLYSLSSGEECWTRWKNASIADWTQDSGIRSTWLVHGRWDTHALRTMSKREQHQTVSDTPNQCKNLCSLHLLRFKVEVLTRMDVLNSSTDMISFNSPCCVLGWLHTKHATASSTRHFPSSFNANPCCGPASAVFATASNQKRAKLLQWLMMLKWAANFSNTAVHFALRLPGAFGVLHEW